MTRNNLNMRTRVRTPGPCQTREPLHRGRGANPAVHTHMQRCSLHRAAHVVWLSSGCMAEVVWLSAAQSESGTQAACAPKENMGCASAQVSTGKFPIQEGVRSGTVHHCMGAWARGRLGPRTPALVAFRCCRRGGWPGRDAKFVFWPADGPKHQS